MPFWEKEEVPSIEELRELYQENDFTTYPIDFDVELASDDELYLLKRVEQLITQEWNRCLDWKGKLEDYSKTYPIRALRDADSRKLAEIVVSVTRQEDTLSMLTEMGSQIIANRLESILRSIFQKNR